MSAALAASSDVASPVLTAKEFAWFTDFLHHWTGIELRPGKESLVMGRLERRLRRFDLSTYSEYFQLLGRRDAPEETRIAIDLMTTNETYFFREPEHFELLPQLLPARASSGQPLRVWSAASSTGEEACSIALTLADCVPDRQWEVLGTDLSTRVIETARRGLYPIEAADTHPGTNARPPIAARAAVSTRASSPCATSCARASHSLART